MIHEVDKFWVIAVISNPVRYDSRYRLYKKFEHHMHKAGVQMLTVELSLGDREFAITEAHNERHLQLHSKHELWHKENMINLGLARLPIGWKYVCWIDADIEFTNHDWVVDTMHALQHYHIVQMFSHAIDLGPEGQHIQTQNGFMWSYLTGRPVGKSYPGWHPGFAWAARKEAINKVGRLYDQAILGSGDHHMARAMIGQVLDSVPHNATSNYLNSLKIWQDRCESHIKRNVGYVPGTILHHWHGRKKDRRYNDRWKILIDNQYDPLIDLKEDWQGLWQLTDRSIQLRDDIRQYFRSRNEDSIDVE